MTNVSSLLCTFVRPALRACAVISSACILTLAGCGAEDVSDRLDPELYGAVPDIRDLTPELVNEIYTQDNFGLGPNTLFGVSPDGHLAPLVTRGDILVYTDTESGGSREYQVIETRDGVVVMASDNGERFVYDRNLILPPIEMETAEMAVKRDFTIESGALFPLRPGNRMEFRVKLQIRGDSSTYGYLWACEVMRREELILLPGRFDAWRVECLRDGMDRVIYHYSPVLAQVIRRETMGQPPSVHQVMVLSGYKLQREIDFVGDLVTAAASPLENQIEDPDAKLQVEITSGFAARRSLPLEDSFASAQVPARPKPAISAFPGQQLAQNASDDLLLLDEDAPIPTQPSQERATDMPADTPTDMTPVTPTQFNENELVLQANDPTGFFGIHLVSYKNSGHVLRFWDELKAQLSPYLDNKKPETRRVILPDLGTYYRVYAWPYATRAEAEVACDQINRIRGQQYCGIIRF